MTSSNSLKPKKFRSQKRANITSLVLTYIILIVLAFIWLIPFVWIILSSFRCEYNGGTFVGTVTSNFFPKAYGFTNYQMLFSATYYGVPNAFIKWIYHNKRIFDFG